MRQLSRTCLMSALALVIAGCGDKSPAPGRGEEKLAMETSTDVATPAPASAPAMAERRSVVARAAVGDAAGAAPRASFATLGAAAAEPVFDPTAMLIRRATAGVEVERLDRAVAAARTAAARHGGIVANAQVATGRSEVHRAVLQLRVPSDRFDALLGELGPLGRVEAVNVSTQDVGEEYVDMEARLANLRRLEARIIELLANRTGKLSDVLSVEGELARVRGEIEQIEGRRRYLLRASSMSTLELTLHEHDPILANTPVRGPIANAIHRAWRNFIDVVALGISALGVLVPFGLLVAAIVLATRWLRRRPEGDSLAAGV